LFLWEAPERSLERRRTCESCGSFGGSTSENELREERRAKAAPHLAFGRISVGSSTQFFLSLQTFTFWQRISCNYLPSQGFRVNHGKSRQ